MQSAVARDLRGSSFDVHCLCLQLGKPRYKHISVIDLTGFGRKHTGGDFRKPMMEVLDQLQAYYPESVKKVYILNAPWIFRAFWAGIKPFLHPNTVAAVDILGADYLDVFKKNGINEDQLPVYLGGVRPPKDGELMAYCLAGCELPVDLLPQAAGSAPSPMGSLEPEPEPEPEMDAEDGEGLIPDRQAVLEAALADRQAELALPGEEGLLPGSEPEPEPQLGEGLVLELRADAVELEMPAAEGDGFETPDSEYGTPLVSFQRGSQVRAFGSLLLAPCCISHSQADLNLLLAPW